MLHAGGGGLRFAVARITKIVTPNPGWKEKRAAVQTAAKVAGRALS